MAKKSFKKITSVKASSIATFEGTLFAAMGFVVALLRSLDTTIQIADSTDSTLLGLSFGLAAGAVALIVLPLIYFGIGWIVGYLHGWLFNAVASSNGGIEVEIEE
jgi:hypothetical protein